MIQFEECQYNKNIVDELHLKNVIHNSTHDVLSYAMDCGAYIAGGFAYKFCESHLTSETMSRPWYPLTQYIWGFDRDSYLNGNIFLKHSDIDVWFPNEDAIQKFKENYSKFSELYNPIIRSTKTNFGEEIICFNQHNTQGQIVQAITKIHGELQDVLSSFDIYNAMCYIKDDKYYIPEGWRWLNDNKYLHVHNAATPYIVSRIVKWFNKHQFKKLTPTSIEVVNSGIAKFFANREMTDDFAKVKNVISKVSPLMENITNENLLLIAACFEEEAYKDTAEYAKDELYKRSLKTLGKDTESAFLKAV